MDTKFWGGPGWIFLFSIAFNYPLHVDRKNREHRERRRYTRQLFLNLQYTLPCKYCRVSFRKFLRRLPIDDHLDGRAALTRWLYRIRNMVNAKLRRQERAAVRRKERELRRRVARHELTPDEAVVRLAEFIAATAITGPDPPFEEVCARYEAHRAGCVSTKEGLSVCRSPTRSPG